MGREIESTRVNVGRRYLKEIIKKTIQKPQKENYLTVNDQNLRFNGTLKPYVKSTIYESKINTNNPSQN
jgi:hypothetical protein